MAALPSLTTVSPGRSPAGSGFSSSAVVSVGARLVSSAEDSAVVGGGLVVGTSGAVFRCSMDLSPLLAAAAMPKLNWNVCVAERVREGCRWWEMMRGKCRAVRTSIKVQRLEIDKWQVWIQQNISELHSNVSSKYTVPVKRLGTLSHSNEWEKHVQTFDWYCGTHPTLDFWN